MSRSFNNNDDALQKAAIKLSALEARREEKRRHLQELFNQKQQIERKMTTLENELMHLDNDIEKTEQEITSVNFPSTQAFASPVLSKVKQETEPDAQNFSSNTAAVDQPEKDYTARPASSADEILTDPTSPMPAKENTRINNNAMNGRPNPQILAAASATVASKTRNNGDDEEKLWLSDDDEHDDPIMTMTTQLEPGDDENNEPPLYLQQKQHHQQRPQSRGSNRSIAPLQLATIEQPNKKKKKKRDNPPTAEQAAAATAPLHVQYSNQENNHVVTTAATDVAGKTSTIDSFFAPQNRKPPSSTLTAREAAQMPRQQQHRDLPKDDQFSAGKSYPWSADVYDLLRNVFKIESFRDHQKEIIDATLSGDDVFVVMRTGGGKSLTYQLPALLEGRYRKENKVTFVVSPLLSLIQDQEDQMNAFAPGSAYSFTSGLTGGASEHARRWAAVNDPSQQVCLVFVTPEKVYKSNKLRNEMQKLFSVGRLGRFVIDECHCACQWGHDFRPDYAKLGMLKRHFPTIPMLAVTATASNRVRDDVCQILNLKSTYRIFQSTANRPNLSYSVRIKPDTKDAVMAAMAAFIKENHPNGAGIVYTFSKKDADTVADAFCEYGIVARSYHSDVSTKNKELIHRSWMRNETQVVVATIAFGLGINKPDVRFVLHHSISKSLEGYYQESGRAGRDGLRADCVLYYSPKDVIRMLKMVHGTSGDQLTWTMVRYAQASGNDAVCRAIILAHLQEPGHLDVQEVQRQNEGLTTERRDVGKHAQTVARLLYMCTLQAEEKMTLSKLTKEWRTKSSAYECVRENPPGKDGLSPTECERIIIALLVERVFDTDIVWTAYDSVVYLVLTDLGQSLVASADPHMIVHLPKRKTKKPGAAAAASKTTKQAARQTVSKSGEWLSSKPKATRKRKTKASSAKRRKNKTKKAKSQTSRRRKNSKSDKNQPLSKVIELLSDDEDEGLESHQNLPDKRELIDNDSLWEDEDEDSDEFEFEG